MRLLPVFLLSALGALAHFAMADNSDELKPYPAAESGQTRYVLRLPALENEDDRLLEILAGKTLQVDCNRQQFGGSLEERIAEGWGYPYYLLSVGPGPMSTMMACPPDEQPREAFVRVQGEGFRVRYNSQLPVVVYVPEGFQVRYRIWAASEESIEAQPE